MGVCMANNLRPRRIGWLGVVTKSGCCSSLEVGLARSNCELCGVPPTCIRDTLWLSCGLPRIIHDGHGYEDGDGHTEAVHG